MHAMQQLWSNGKPFAAGVIRSLFVDPFQKVGEQWQRGKSGVRQSSHDVVIPQTTEV